MYLCTSYCLLCMFSVSDSLIYMIYCRSFNFRYVICYYLYLHNWTTSFDHAHVYLLCMPFGFIICTHRVTSDNLEFSCPDPRDRTLVTLAVTDQSAQRIFPWWSECSRSLDVAVALPSSSSPIWLSRSLLLLMSTSQLLYISLYYVLLYFLVM